MSATGFAPEYWGPQLWRVIHMMAMNYPVRPTKAHKDDAMAFFASLKTMLPCEGCRKGYVKMVSSGPLKLTPQVFATRMTLFAWTVDIHNAVNKRLGKPSTKTWQQWYAHYERFRS